MLFKYMHWKIKLHIEDFNWKIKSIHSVKSKSMKIYMQFKEQSWQYAYTYNYNGIGLSLFKIIPNEKCKILNMKAILIEKTTSLE